ncbi:hypothetical protein Tco_1191205 [Tanacetum coccineum]
MIRNKLDALETFWNDDLFQQDTVVELQLEPYHGVDQDQEIANMLVEVNPLNGDVVFQSNDQAKPVVDPFVQQIDKEVVEREEILVDEGFVNGDTSDFDHEDSHIPKTKYEVDMQKFNFMIDVNLDQVRMAVDKIWDDCGVEIIELDELDSGGKGDEE